MQLIIKETQKAQNEEEENPTHELNFDVGGEVKVQNGTAMKTLDCDFLKELEESLEKNEDDSIGLTFTEIQ